MKSAKVEDRLADLIDDREFRNLNQHLRRFNIFEAIGAVRGELRHSNFLSFILSPTRPHGIGSEFLLQFLRSAVSKLPSDRRPIQGLELILADLDSAVLHREQDNIDLIIELSHMKFAVLIENKIDAAVGVGQLARYKQAIKSRYPNYRYLFVLLTPDGIKANEDDFVSLSYSELSELIDGSIRDKDIVSSEVSLVLRHYVQMLRRNIVQDDRLIDLSRQIYQRHKEALDFIFEHRSRADTLLDGIRSLLNADESLVTDRHAPMILRFAPTEWHGVELFNCCPTSAWTHSNRNLLFEIKAYKDSDRVSVALVSGPAETPIRSNLYAFAAADPEVFLGLVKPMGVKWATIFTRDLLGAKVAEAMESEEKQATVVAEWKNFQSTDLVRIKARLATLVAQN